MKILKIESSNGFFINNKNEYDNIINISRDDLIFLIKKVLEEETELDEISDENQIGNLAERIIYENILLQLIDLQKNRDTVNKKINSMYDSFISKYSLNDIDIIPNDIECKECDNIMIEDNNNIIEGNSNND